MATGFTNSFTSGEICDEAWDRTDLQPIAKGCEEATNLVIRIAGPLAKRRGFWRLGAVADETKLGRLVPFRHSIDDALMLEFGDGIVRVWNNDGSPVMSGMAQVQFNTPFNEPFLPGLRWKQIGDVIYLRGALGPQPHSITRVDNTTWTVTKETFPNGPWLAENIDQAFTLTVTVGTATSEADQNPDTGAGTILADGTVHLVASAALFDTLHVGAMFRIRQNDGAPGVKAWTPGYRPALGNYALSNGRVYVSTHVGAVNENVANPPTVETGKQSDGANEWTFRHDGAGVVQITAVADSTHATAQVLNAMPFKTGQVTSYFAEGAYSDFRGWPRMWPGLREERMVEGATAQHLDFADLTETAGFSPGSESFRPNLGGGVVLATDAVRRRMGADGAELIWSHETTYELLGSTAGEFLIAGSVLDEPISPSSVVVKQLSDFGSADVYPAKAHAGLLYVARGGQTLRELTVDAGQNADNDDLSVLATHIAERGMVRLAWISQPDETLWIQLADGGLAAMVYHKKQQVRGFCRVALPAGWVCEDVAALPGPGRLETLWGLFSRVKAGVTQRQLWMLSAKTDALFMDAAEFYSGAPATVIGGLAHFEGEAVRVLADGAQIAPDPVVVGGDIVLKTAASVVLVGSPIATRFKSLKLDTQLGGSLNARQRVTGCTVSLKTALAKVGLDGSPLTESVRPRLAGDVPAAVARRMIQNVALAGDSSRDPRIVIEDDSAYDCLIYSLKPQVQAGE